MADTKPKSSEATSHIIKRITHDMTTDKHPTQKRQFNILRMEEVPLEDIETHPNNPRPSFHMNDDDPWLIRLGESIKVDGQHRPAVVYEKKGGWREENEPDKYRLYQGERRFRASKAVGQPTLLCFVAATPENESEEWDWLGVEEAFKQDWQPFFVLKYCKQLADTYGVSVNSQEISAKTGVAMTDLRIAEKLFKLDPAIQFFAAEYEEMMYDQLINGTRRPQGRLTGTGVRSKEFPVSKAAAVWDVFEALRDHCTLLVKQYSDVELQQLIAGKATHGATIEDIQKLHGQIKQLGKNPPPGLLTEISELLSNQNRSVKDTIKATGAEHTKKVNMFFQRSPKLRKLFSQIHEHVNQIGSDPDSLDDIQGELLLLIKDASELERIISARQRELLKALR